MSHLKFLLVLINRVGEISDPFLALPKTSKASKYLRAGVTVDRKVKEQQTSTKLT